MNIPIGNSKEDRQKRKELISQNTGKLKGQKVFCPALNVDVLISGTGINEMIEHSSKSYYSTLAALDLKSQIKIAKFYRYHIPKDNKQIRRDFVFMIELHGKLENKVTKIMIGVKLTAKYKHYCITAMDE